MSSSAAGRPEAAVLLRAVDGSVSSNWFFWASPPLGSLHSFYDSSKGNSTNSEKEGLLFGLTFGGFGSLLAINARVTQWH
ncbi:Rab5, partial [Caligus rogercresseyi]